MYLHITLHITFLLPPCIHISIIVQGFMCSTVCIMRTIYVHYLCVVEQSVIPDGFYSHLHLGEAGVPHQTFQLVQLEELEALPFLGPVKRRFTGRSSSAETAKSPQDQVQLVSLVPGTLYTSLVYILSLDGWCQARDFSTRT